MTRPVVNLADVPLRDGGNGGKFAAKLARIGALIGAQKLGCQLHVVPAGKRAFPRHAHHVNEEMFFVLTGEGTYRVGDETYPIREGDVIGAPAGDASTAHQIVNTSDGELRYLGFSTRLDPDVVEYPDSNKFAVASMAPQDKGLMAAKLLYIGRREGSLGYFDGEE
ncbi:MAG TPA: cupin domain-containing protein [Roseiarcus sp.]|nr:cupin domain-containing protein [Roseiarcus sp.]